MKVRDLWVCAAVFPLSGLASLALGGCNTAQISQPAQVDAGPPCENITPLLTCDAGAAPAPGNCAGNVPVVLDVTAADAGNTIPAGSFAPGCTVAFFYQDPASAVCNRAPACTCVGADAGGGGDGGGEAGPAEAGAPAGSSVWSCVPMQ
jgi:hypothetical protein